MKFWYRIYSLWKLVRAKSLLKQTPLGRSLLAAAGPVQFCGASEQELRAFRHQSLKIRDPIGLFYIDDQTHKRTGRLRRQKNIVFLRTLSVPKLAVVLAHELTHASDIRYHLKPEENLEKSEKLAIELQYAFAFQLLEQRPKLRRYLK